MLWSPARQHAGVRVIRVHADEIAGAIVVGKAGRATDGVSEHLTLRNVRAIFRRAAEHLQVLSSLDITANIWNTPPLPARANVRGVKTGDKVGSPVAL